MGSFFLPLHYPHVIFHDEEGRGHQDAVQVKSYSTVSEYV